MYAIKVWSTKVENSWYLMRDPTDYVVHCYGRQSRAEAVVKHLLEQNPKMRIEVTQDISVAAIKRATDKRQQAQENEK
jgi:DNA-directed RNA polymerase subunit L